MKIGEMRYLTLLPLYLVDDRYPVRANGMLVVD